MLTRYFFKNRKDKFGGDDNYVVDMMDLMPGRVIQQWSFPGGEFEWNAMGSWGDAFYYPWVRIGPDYGGMIVSYYDLRVSEL